MSTLLLLLALLAFVAAGVQAGRRKPPAWWDLLVAVGLALFIAHLLVPALD